ncbi:TPA: fructose-bisphosphate aldolase [Candidatus Magasanikbacteria bacterium]|nr:fructose-bisphosphate aldolase [Candidatus Magasanikbacteria bacterium]
MLNYKKLGFENTKKMYQESLKKNYALPGYNVSNMEQVQSVLSACLRTQNSVVMQISKKAYEYIGEKLIAQMVSGAILQMKEEAKKMKLKPISVALHLDHGDSYELCVSAIKNGFSSVMIDASHLSYNENIKLTKKVVNFAHKYKVTVEGELGVLAGVEDDVSATEHIYTRPEEVEDFVKKTGVDSLAIAVGTSHGAYKFKPGQEAKIRLDILKAIEKRLKNFPIVLHGASSIPQEALEKINKYGGKMESAIGIDPKQVRAAAKTAVCKVNIDSDSRITMTASLREVLSQSPEIFDPRTYLAKVREDLMKMYMKKNVEVLGCGKKISK